jgi:uncharacterized protein YjbI with pentapeptide repeats
MKTKMLLAGLACVMMATTAQAACSDPPLPGVDWHGCRKGGSHLEGVHLDKANLTTAILSNANLTNATLTSAKLNGAILTGAILKGADLTAVSVSPQTVWRSGKNCTGNTVATCPK